MEKLKGFFRSSSANLFKNVLSIGANSVTVFGGSMAILTFTENAINRTAQKLKEEEKARRAAVMYDRKRIEEASILRHYDIYVGKVKARNSSILKWGRKKEEIICFEEFRNRVISIAHDKIISSVSKRSQYQSDHNSAILEVEEANKVPEIEEEAIRPIPEPETAGDYWWM